MPKRKQQPEAHIRERARRLWREDGAPKGRMDEYLERARELQAIEDHPSAGLLPNPMTEHGGAIPTEQPVEEAEAMENLGEFPNRLTDQGDRSPVPMTRKKAHRVLRED
jgi:Protein of unknown function (DUF2934)